jgi:cellulose synthase/poly-beta-1,6-N-acetylglucosamine synthase-like glycosyltransferase
MKYPKVSIIIPFKSFNQKLEECIKYCNELDYPNYEIILLPDNKCDISYKNVKVIPTGQIGPSEKRDIGMKNSSGEIFAFLDDDAFPIKDWLKNAIRHFEDKEIGAVVGPAVTPDNDDIWQKGSGLVFSSYLASGKYVYRYLPKSIRYEDDYPTVNFIVPKDVIDKIGGFDNTYWPGEDTILCLKITRDLKKKIIYDPKVLVYHHRRRLFKEHLKQVSNYATHRGFFVKKFPETSFRFGYFVPSLFVLGIILGFVLSMFFPLIKIVYISVLLLYLLLLIIEGIRVKNLKLGILVFLGILSTHIVYGIWFIKGLLSRELVR